MIRPILCASALLIASLGAQEPDNTKTNRRDRPTGAVTADQQKMNAADGELARKIRKSVVSDKTLSTYAHNVKIIARDGMVILRGPVRSAEEKEEIGKKAIAIAGMAKVTNDLELAPPKK